MAPPKSTKRSNTTAEMSVVIPPGTGQTILSDQTNLKNLINLLKTPSHSDLTINTPTASFPAHLVILSWHTNFFTRAAKNDNTVTMRDTTAAAVWGLLQWCYSSDIAGEVPNEYLSEGKTSAVGIVTDIYLLADKLVIPNLKAFCAMKVKAMIPDRESRQERIWPMDKVGMSMRDLMEEVFENTDNENDLLRMVLTRKAMLWHPVLMGESAYVEFLRKHKEVMIALLKLFRFVETVISADEGVQTLQGAAQG